MTRYSELSHQLGVTPSAGLETLRRFGLNTEASMSDDINSMGDFSDVLVSAHAPAVIGDLRLNIASTDADFRATSIQVINDYISRPVPQREADQFALRSQAWDDDARRWVETGSMTCLSSADRNCTFELVLKLLDDIDAPQTGHSAMNVGSMSIATTWVSVSTPATS